MKYKVIELINMFKSKKRLSKKNADYQSRAVREIDLLMELKEKSNLIIDLQKEKEQLIKQVQYLEEALADYENKEDYIEKAVKECKSITTFKKKYFDLKKSE